MGLLNQSSKGSVTAQDDTGSLPAEGSSAAQSDHIDTSTDLSAVDASSTEEGEHLPSPSADVPALVHDHTNLPTRFDGPVDIITGSVV